MEDITLDVLKFDYNDKIAILRKIAHEIRKKRFILNENTERFGFDKMKQLVKVKNTSEVKGIPFVCSKTESKILKGHRIALKIVPNELKYNKDEHPINLEFLALKELTNNIVTNNISPHIVYYLGNQKVSNKCKALKFLNLKRLEVEELVRTHSNMLISEFIEGNSLDNWVYDWVDDGNEITNEEWKILTFQVVYTLAVIQKKYKLMHNDMHYGNILIDTSIKKGGYFVYTINSKTYYIKNTGFIPKLFDFEFAMSYSNKIPDFYPNKFIIGKYDYDRTTHVTKEPVLGSDISTDFNVPYNYNEVYDLHYFLTSLLDLYISQDLFDWITKLYPEDLIPRDEDSSKSNSSNSSNSSSSNSEELIKKLDKINLDDKSSIKSSVKSSIKSSVKSNEKSSDGISESSDVSNSDGSSDMSSYNRYLADGRIRNGVEDEFDDLPTPSKLLDHDFFETFTNKPVDFDESKAIYFDAGF
jgi:hypothetical protein